MVRREARLPARIALAAAVLGALAVSVPAAAGTPLEDAKELANTATVQYKLGAFSNALEGYTAAYEKYPTPGLLFNIGQCHKMLKHYEQAIHSFRTFLHDKPNAANREDVEALVAESEHALAAERAAPALPKPPDSTQLAPPPPPPPPAPLTPPPVEATHGSPALRVAGVAVGVAGAALLGTGVYFGLHAGSDSSAIAAAAASRGPWTPQDQATYDDGTRSARAATALYVVGGVALAAGGLLAFLGWRKTGPEPVVTPAVTVGPTGGTVVVRGAF